MSQTELVYEPYNGLIELIIGPMFSGKSTELMRKVKRYQIAQKKCLVVNYAKDNRYSNLNVIATHDNQTLCALKAHTLEDILDLYIDYDVVAIDEGQFFTDIVEKSEIFANAGKIVIVAALDATFQRKAFGRVLELIPMAEKVTKLSAVCVVCNNDAFFTQRISDDKEVEVIGSNDIYRAVCRSCFHKAANKEKSSPKGKTSLYESSGRNASGNPTTTSQVKTSTSSPKDKASSGIECALPKHIGKENTKYDQDGYKSS